jgi:hypothetical protein
LAKAPPLPHSIAGYVFKSNGQQVPLATSYTINETNSSDFIKSETSIEVPGMSGRYFEVINGSNGDFVVLFAWNATHYGKKNVTLVGDMDNVNITINKKRDVELNVTITFPHDNGVFQPLTSLNVSAKIKVLGANGNKCNVTVSLTNEQVLNISPGQAYSHSLGNPARGITLYTYWNVSAYGGGSSNITVTARCSNEGLYLESNKRMTVRNLTVRDKIRPKIYLISPTNSSVVKVSKTVIFYYNVSDASRIQNCTLVINKKINMTNTTRVVKNKKLNFTKTLSNGKYNWSVNCTDSFGNVGTGGVFNLTVAVYAPFFSRIVVTNPVNLVSGGTFNVTCNATVVHDFSASSITVVNATFYDATVSKGGTPDDKNSHYHDNNCKKLSNSSKTMNVSCVFQVYYYANNGTWRCNMTAFDKNNMTNSSNISAAVGELFAIGADSILDFGNLVPGTTSPDVNLSLYNYGNRDIMVTVEGFGKQRFDNLSMMCKNKGNLSNTMERYSVTYQQPFDEMKNLSATPVLLGSILRQRTDDYIYTNDSNKTFWKLSIPLGLKGACNGTITFGAVKT